MEPALEQFRNAALAEGGMAVGAGVPDLLADQADAFLQAALAEGGMEISAGARESHAVIADAQNVPASRSDSTTQPLAR